MNDNGYNGYNLIYSDELYQINELYNGLFRIYSVDYIFCFCNEYMTGKSPDSCVITKIIFAQTLFNFAQCCNYSWKRILKYRFRVLVVVCLQTRIINMKGIVINAPKVLLENTYRK